MSLFSWTESMGVVRPIGLALLLAATAAAQIPNGASPQAVPAGVRGRSLSSYLYGYNGFRLESLFVSATNYWSGIPTLSRSENISAVMGGASMGWAHVGERSSAIFNYTPTYTGYVQFPELNTSAHSLSFSGTRHLSSQTWNVSGGFGAQYNSTEQILFTPTVLRTAASLPATFDELADSLLSSAITNEQLGSMLTGAPVVDLPSRQLLFGDTVFSTFGHLALSHRLSGRTSVSVSIAIARMQPVSTNRDIGTGGHGALGQSTSGSVTAGMSYSVSPRTQVGFAVSESRIVSRFQDTYQTAGSAFIGRKLSRRWFGQIYGGGGAMRSVRSQFQLPGGAQYQAGGSAGFRTYSHTVLFSSGRSFGDRYGIGAASTVTASAAWNWARPGRSWNVYATVGQQWFQGGGPGGLSSWQASGGTSKALSSHLSVSANYSYATAGRSNLGQRLAQRAASVSLVWTPQPTIVEQR